MTVHTRQYLVPGYGYVNEIQSRQYLIPGGVYVNETVIESSTASAALTEEDDALGAAVQAHATLTTSHVILRQYLAPTQGYINETGFKDYLVPGRGYVNESCRPILAVAETDDTLAATASVRITTHASIQEEEDAGGSTHTPTVFDLTAGIPAGWTYTRGDNLIATARDSGGELQLIGSNVPRIDHDASGNALGMLFEEARVNLCANYNMAPTDATGLSTTGTATVAAVSDAAAVATAKLDAVITGSVIEAAGGASGGTVVISGATGATGAFSASLYARVTVGSSASFGITPNATAATISGSAYARFTAANLTSTLTTDTLVITIPAGVTIRFILNQLEAGAFATSVIKVAGATASRSADFLQFTGLATAPWWNTAQGTIIASVNPYQANEQANAAAVVMASSTGIFPTDAFYLQTNNVSNKPSAWGKASNSSVNAAALTGVIPGRKNPVGIIYQNGGSVVCFAGPMVYGPYNSTVTMTGSAANIVNLTVGSFANGAGSFNGWIDRLTFFGVALTLLQAGPYSLGPFTGHTERALIGGGQSNMANNCTAPPDSTNEGELAYDAFLDTLWGTSTRNWVIAGAATGGTSFTAWQSSNSGAAIAKWKSIAAAYLAGGGTIEGILWDQGEADLGYTTAQFVTAYLGIFQDMQTYLHGLGCPANLPVIIRPLGRYRLNATESTNTNCMALRLAQQQLASQNPSIICISPEKSFEPLVDNLVHLTGAGYANHAPLDLRKLFAFIGGYGITGGVDGPTITNVTRAGNVLTHTLAHDAGGSDFTPTSGIGGFQFYDGGTLIANTSVVRTNATTITQTLASTPTSGTYQLRHAMGSIYNDDGSTLVRDNSSNGLPLRAAVITLADAAAVAVTEDDDTASGTLARPISATVAAAEDDDLAAIHASVPHAAATLAVTEQDDVATGTLVRPINTTVAATEEDDRLVAMSRFIPATPSARILAAPAQTRLLQPAKQNRTL